jgi:transposase
MRFVPIKSKAQQDLQALHRVREQLLNSRTALVNQVRGLLRTPPYRYGAGTLAIQVPHPEHRKGKQL